LRRQWNYRNGRRVEGWRKGKKHSFHFAYRRGKVNLKIIGGGRLNSHWLVGQCDDTIEGRGKVSLVCWRGGGGEPFHSNVMVGVRIGNLFPARAASDHFVKKGKKRSYFNWSKEDVSRPERGGLQSPQLVSEVVASLKDMKQERDPTSLLVLRKNNSSSPCKSRRRSLSEDWGSILPIKGFYLS